MAFKSKYVDSVYCLMRQKHCWGYFAFSLTRLVEMVRLRLHDAWPA